MSGSLAICRASISRVRNVPLRSSAPSAASVNSASAKAANGSDPGVITAARQASTSGTVPGNTSRGSSPARSSEDLPDPLAPITSRNGTRPACSAACSRSIAWPMAMSRPKNTRPRSAPNAARPGNGEPSSTRSHTGPCAR